MRRVFRRIGHLLFELLTAPTPDTGLTGLGSPMQWRHDPDA
jgi:hypothetical protein